MQKVVNSGIVWIAGRSGASLKKKPQVHIFTAKYWELKYHLLYITFCNDMYSLSLILKGFRYLVILSCTCLSENSIKIVICLKTWVMSWSIYSIIVRIKPKVSFSCLFHIHLELDKKMIVHLCVVLYVT